MMKQSLIYQLRQLSTGRVCNNLCWPKADYGPLEVQRSVLMNGIKVAAAKHLGAQIASCTIMYQLGATHFIRAASSASGCGYTSFSKMRVLQQHGCSLTCSSDRQTIAFTLRCPLTCFSELRSYLLDAASRCCYHQWEMDDRKTLVREDLIRLNRIDEMYENSLNCYASTHFKSDICTVASVGLPFEETMKLAEKIQYVRTGQHFHDRSPMAPLGTMAGTDVYTQYRAFNISYMDTGVFGILAKSKAHAAWNTAIAASEFLIKIGDLTCQQIEVGKNRLKLALALHDEDPVRVSEGLALQLASNVQLDSAKNSMCLAHIWQWLWSEILEQYHMTGN
ncbi:Cytochrome b-c1 complex subunit 2, mitochondrial [Operophtera brumata]|uniref:Cytochrome b-c1 complex subunit 2, mitochondrial n=1 Tax=Operophtera brumata TaxID=104452 RepID=A0A0L7LSH7_OPEBR|nr:Cytochrome b-c1 complex subunit 2, mitochondrial [Operophtera brumata]